MFFLRTVHVQTNMQKVREWGAFSGQTHPKLTLLSALNRGQGSSIPASPAGICVEFDNPRLVEELVRVRVLREADIAGGRHLVAAERRPAMKAKVQQALALIREKSPPLHKLIEDLVGTIIVLRNGRHLRGGTVSSHVGLIWLSPLSKWSVREYAHAIVHEFIHNSVFLDDMVNTLYPEPDRLAEDAAMTTSAILQISRPLDRAYHSACVAVGTIYFDHLLGREENGRTFLGPLRTTLADLRTKRAYLTDHGWELLQELEDFARTVDYRRVDEALAGAPARPPLLVQVRTRRGASTS